MLTISLYVDNLHNKCYDIPIVIRNWEADKIMLFVGSCITYDILKSQITNPDIEIFNISIPIRRPVDIPLAFNACVNYCYDTIETDALVFVNADTYISKAAMQFIQSVYNKSMVMTMKYDHIQLYSYMWAVSPGVVLSNKYHKIYWDETDDGTTVTGATEGQKDYIHEHYDRDFITDIGYFPVQTYINKIRNHNAIWPNAYKDEALKRFSADKADGLRFAYTAISEYCNLSLIPSEPNKELFSYFHCWDEYYWCADIMKTIPNRY